MPNFNLQCSVGDPDAIVDLTKCWEAVKVLWESETDFKQKMIIVVEKKRTENEKLIITSNFTLLIMIMTISEFIHVNHNAQDGDYYNN